VIEIIPVIDLKRGDVVHAVRGERNRYVPVVSRLTKSSRPGDVAAAFAKLGARHVYVADLDAIAGEEPDFAAYESIADTGLLLWLDAGIRHAADARRIASSFGDTGKLSALVIGTETLESIDAIAELAESFNVAELVLSLDHHSGTPLTQNPAWRTASVVDIACEVAGLGVGRFVDLDLARVGSSQGPQSSAHAAAFREAIPDASLAIGGGIRNPQDVAAMAELGYDAALVATALHSGTITAEDFHSTTRFVHSIQARRASE